MRSESPHMSRWLAALLLISGLGCHSARPSTFNDLQPAERVRLSASRAFTVYPLAPSPSAPRCMVRSLEGRVASIARDTLYLREFAVREGSDTDRACEWSGAAFLIRSEAPDLDVREVRVSGLRTTLMVIVALPAGLIVLALLSYGGAPG